MFNSCVEFIRELFPQEGTVVLHEPIFSGNERQYVCDAIDSTFVSSVGEFVTRFERMFADYVGCKYAIATVNGTAALHIALKLSGVKEGDEVITQPLTFAATCNAISYCNATPVFVDIDTNTLSLSPQALKIFLKNNTKLINGQCINQLSNKVIRTCVPMHTFGFSARIDEIIQICDSYNITVVEDAAEALGTRYKGQHVGTFGELSIFSFNGNKVITTGGGGMITTDDEELALKAKHITTTAKVAHSWEYYHDEVGYNYRLPNLNAALGCAQLEKLPPMLAEKKILAQRYHDFFAKFSIKHFYDLDDMQPNYWLNTIMLSDKNERDSFLEYTNTRGVMTRPAWALMSKLPAFGGALRGDLSNAQALSDRLINLPSSVSGFGHD